MSNQICEKLVKTRMIDSEITSLSDLSRKSGVSRPKIYQLLKQRNPYQSSFVKIARALSVTPEELLAEGIADDSAGY